MTVAELIAELQQEPPHREVVLEVHGAQELARVVISCENNAGEIHPVVIVGRSYDD